MADNVFINGRAAVHAGSAGKSVAFPDVCLCPPSPPSGPIPTPLVNTAMAADLDGCAATVTVQGNRIAHAQSFVARSSGDEAAQSTGGGIISHTTQGRAYFQSFSMNVRIENQPAVRHLDLVTNNHMRKTPGNTPPVPWMSTMLAGPGPAPMEVEKRVGKKKDWIELTVIDQAEHPAFRVRYCVTLPDGNKVEGRLSIGGQIKLSGIEKGTCTVEFNTAPAAPGQAKPKNAQAHSYKDTPLKLETGKVHLIQVNMPRVLRVALPFDPKDERYAKHRFVLRSKDGEYEAKRSIADDAVAGDQKLTLEFADLVPDKVYSLVHFDGDAMVSTLFAEQCYEDLFPPMSALRVSQRKRQQSDTSSMDIPVPVGDRIHSRDDILLGTDLEDSDADGSTEDV
jgi:hypothetical protein